MNDKTNEQKGSWWLEIDHRADLDQLEGYREVKALLQEHDENAGRPQNEEDEFFARLHDKIMAGVEKTTIKPDQRSLWDRYHRQIKGWVSAAALLTLLCTGVDISVPPLSANQTDLVLEDALAHSPGLDNSILVYQSKDDFFVDLATESLNHLSVDRLQGLVGAARD